MKNKHILKFTLRSNHYILNKCIITQSYGALISITQETQMHSTLNISRIRNQNHTIFYITIQTQI